MADDRNTDRLAHALALQVWFVKTPASLQKAGKVLARSVMLGLDTETKPTFSAGARKNRTALLQVRQLLICWYDVQCMRMELRLAYCSVNVTFPFAPARTVSFT